MSSPPILIVGAGPSGLVLAIWLRLLESKVPFRIVSNASGPGTQSRAIIVHARTLEYYRQLGIADQIIKAGQKVESVNIMQYTQRRGQLKFGDIGQGLSEYPMVLALPQDRHEEILLQRLEELGGRVEWNTTVETVDQQEDYVNVQIKKSLERYEYVVGCDGANSIVRSSNGIEMKGGTYSQRFFVADVVLNPSRLPVGIEVTPADGEVVLALPLGEGDVQQVRLVGCYKPKDADEHGKGNFDEVRELVLKATNLQVEKVNWFSTYRVHHRFALQFRDRRIFLVGDAAHCHSPVGGQGMNTGIGDACNLAWKLAAVVSDSQKQLNVQDLLQSYHVERIKFAEILVQTTDALFYHVTQPDLFGRFLRGIFMPYILPLIWMLPWIPSLAFQRISQTAIEYRNSAVSAPEIAGYKIQPGDRVPFISFGHEHDNHEPLSTPGWQIHRYSGVSSTSDSTEFKGIPIRDWKWNEACKHTGLVQDKVYLIRPDGHISFIGDSLQDLRLENYLVKWSL